MGCRPLQGPQPGLPCGPLGGGRLQNGRVLWVQGEGRSRLFLFLNPLLVGIQLAASGVDWVLEGRHLGSAPTARPRVSPPHLPAKGKMLFVALLFPDSPFMECWVLTLGLSSLHGPKKLGQRRVLSVSLGPQVGGGGGRRRRLPLVGWGGEASGKHSSDPGQSRAGPFLGALGPVPWPKGRGLPGQRLEQSPADGLRQVESPGWADTVTVTLQAA